MVENIFSGGDGWSLGPTSSRPSRYTGPYDDDGDTSGSLSGDEGYGGTLRPSDFRRVQRRVERKLASERTSGTVRDETKENGERARSRSGSLTSLAPTMGSSEREREGSKGAREITEAEARDDMVAWRLSGQT